MALSTERRRRTIDFTLSEQSRSRDTHQLLRLTNLYCESFGRRDHRDVEVNLERDLKKGQKFFCIEEDGHLVAFASWHPHGEARTGTGELCYIGWLHGIRGEDVVPELLATVESHAARWFVDKFRYTKEWDADSRETVKVERKDFDPSNPPVRLRMLYTIVPAPRSGAIAALCANGFVQGATLSSFFDDATDGVYLLKHFQKPEAV